MAMSQWGEQKTRSELEEENCTVLGPEQNRYYIKSIAESIQYIAVNEEEVNPEELFNVLFLFNIQQDAKLKAIVSSIPASAAYTSPDIPNEVISVLGSMVIEEIAFLYKTSEVNFFCLKAVQTHDASDVEHLSVVVRFVKDGRPVEHLLGLHPLSHLTADYISDLLLQVLTDCGFNPKQLIVQCYDGASVMSGTPSGVQKKNQEKLGKTIPYIHCYSHQLYVVIVNACSKILPVKRFFDTCDILYNLVRKHQVNQLYSGSQLKGLLDHRWTGHLATAKAVSDNFGGVLIALSNLADPEGEAAAFTELQLEANGLLLTCADERFIFLALLMKDVLSVFEPGNAALQDKDMQLGKAAEVVNACISVLKERRSKADVLFVELLGKTSEIHEQSNIAVDIAEREHKKRRKDFIADGGAEMNGDMSSHMCLKQVFLEVHDCSISEAETRFSNRNMEYLSALDSLIPSSHSFLDVQAVKPLLQLVDANEDNFALEADVVKRNILTPTNPHLKEENSIHNALTVLFSHKNAFPNVYRVLAAAVTFGVSRATCESAFSCLTHILQPPRLSVSRLQINKLLLLRCEKSLTNNINMDAFLDKFHAQSHQLLL